MISNPELSGDARRFLKRLQPLPAAGGRAMLVVLSGPPGAGKSTFARRLSLLLPAVVVNSDHCRKVLLTHPRYSNHEHGRVFRALHQVVALLLVQGHVVIFDATNLSEALRQQAYRVAADAGALWRVIAVVAPPEVIQQRLETRPSGVDPQDWSDATWEVYQRLMGSAEPVPFPDYTVDSTQDYSPLLWQIAQELTSLHPMSVPQGEGRLP